MTIKAWSHSRLGVFESCPLRAKLQYIDRIPEPARPLPPGKLEHANDRGSRVHDGGELFVKGNVELLPELKAFKAEFLALKALYKQGKVSTEGEWAYDVDWNPVAWADPKAWLRMKLDALVRMSKTHAVVIDYKTGRKFGNEFKHGEQGQLYQLGTFLRYPELQVIDVEFWYTDQDEITHMQYKREQGLRFFKNFDTRGQSVTTATDFPAKPNVFTCKWCPYNDGVNCTKGAR
ncbi:MAG: PD-(D/E)XK nuclease family protein [Actinomycetota bacterium]|nr:PD-(D/E)XK nuclease family protein [Actinomycetota bacterium]